LRSVRQIEKRLVEQKPEGFSFSDLAFEAEEKKE